MPLLISYSVRSAFARKLTTTLTVFGLALVVFVFCAVLMLSNGLKQTLVDTGSDNNVIIVRSSATSETVSILDQDMADIIKTDPAIQKDSNGVPMFANEIVILINKMKRNGVDASNIPVRGVTLMSPELRDGFHLTAGRMFTPGTSEIIAGRRTAESFPNCGLGETIRFGLRDWKVVGIFETGGTGFESELWADIDQLRDAFQRHIYSSFTMRILPGTDFASLKKRLESDRRLTVDVSREKDFYRHQSAATSTFFNILGMVISIIFSLGAIVGAMITMYASVANRTIEIGTLRALGFSRLSILSAFLVEALVIAVVSGIVGIAAAQLLQTVNVSTTNWDTFTELAFNFRMSPTIVVKALLFSVVMGLLGGFLPAVRASRLRIINALRAR